MIDDRFCKCIRIHNTYKPNTLNERMSKICSDCEHWLSAHTKDGYCEATMEGDAESDRLRRIEIK